MRSFEYILKDPTNSIENVENSYVDLIFKKLKIDSLGFTKNEKENARNLLLSKIDGTTKNIIDEFTTSIKNKKRWFKKRFNYEVLQSTISNFFMENLEFKICPYCSIEYINSFKDSIHKFNSFEDFLLNGSDDELLRLKDLGKKTLEQIKLARKIKTLDQVNNKKKLKSNFENENFRKSNYNHFTLDHIYPKKANPYLQLSFYNLLPTCYSCNSKFKKESEFSSVVIPNSTNYNLNEKVVVRIVENKDGNYSLWFDLSNAEDAHINYIKTLKLEGRYQFHQDIIKELKVKNDKYGETNIKIISNQLGLSEEEIKKDIFGTEIVLNKYSDNHLSKLKIDVARQLGIIRKP